MSFPVQLMTFNDTFRHL